MCLSTISQFCDKIRQAHQQNLEQRKRFEQEQKRLISLKLKADLFDSRTATPGMKKCQLTSVARKNRSSESVFANECFTPITSKATTQKRKIHFSRCVNYSRDLSYCKLHNEDDICPMITECLVCSNKFEKSSQCTRCSLSTSQKSVVGRKRSSSPNDENDNSKRKPSLALNMQQSISLLDSSDRTMSSPIYNNQLNHEQSKSNMDVEKDMISRTESVSDINDQVSMVVYNNCNESSLACSDQPFYLSEKSVGDNSNTGNDSKLNDYDITQPIEPSDSSFTLIDSNTSSSSSPFYLNNHQYAIDRDAYSDIIRVTMSSKQQQLYAEKDTYYHYRQTPTDNILNESSKEDKLLFIDADSTVDHHDKEHTPVGLSDTEKDEGFETLSNVSENVNNFDVNHSDIDGVKRFSNGTDEITLKDEKTFVENTNTLRINIPSSIIIESLESNSNLIDNIDHDHKENDLLTNKCVMEELNSNDSLVDEMQRLTVSKEQVNVSYDDINYSTDISPTTVTNSSFSRINPLIKKTVVLLTSSVSTYNASCISNSNQIIIDNRIPSSENLRSRHIQRCSVSRRIWNQNDLKSRAKTASPSAIPVPVTVNNVIDSSDDKSESTSISLQSSDSHCSSIRSISSSIPSHNCSKSKTKLRLYQSSNSASVPLVPHLPSPVINKSSCRRSSSINRRVTPQSDSTPLHHASSFQNISVNQKISAPQQSNLIRQSSRFNRMLNKHTEQMFFLNSNELNLPERNS
ncbi:unnamed protein product, partial [Didymodactylos carnosus]